MLARLILLAALGTATALPALADTVSDKAEAVSVTIYRSGSTTPEPGEEEAEADDSGYGDATIAMVTETRMIDVPAGVGRVVFRGVADGIVPQTATLDGLPAVAGPDLLFHEALGVRYRHNDAALATVIMAMLIVAFAVAAAAVYVLWPLVQP